MALSGGVLPVTATFFVFADYMRPAIRLAALSGAKVCFVFTHDSVGLGEDGPTHQPIEHLAALRAIPNLTVIRPADAPETAMAWRATWKPCTTTFPSCASGLHKTRACFRVGSSKCWPSAAPC